MTLMRVWIINLVFGDTSLTTESTLLLTSGQNCEGVVCLCLGVSVYHSGSICCSTGEEEVEVYIGKGSLYKHS